MTRTRLVRLTKLIAEVATGGQCTTCGSIGKCPRVALSPAWPDGIDRRTGHCPECGAHAVIITTPLMEAKGGAPC